MTKRKQKEREHDIGKYGTATKQRGVSSVPLTAEAWFGVH